MYNKIAFYRDEEGKIFLVNEDVKYGHFKLAVPIEISEWPIYADVSDLIQIEKITDPRSLIFENFHRGEDGLRPPITVLEDIDVATVLRDPIDGKVWGIKEKVSDNEWLCIDMSNFSISDNDGKKFPREVKTTEQLLKMDFKLKAKM